MSGTSRAAGAPPPGAASRSKAARAAPVGPGSGLRPEPVGRADPRPVPAAGGGLAPALRAPQGICGKMKPGRAAR